MTFVPRGERAGRPMFQCRTDGRTAVLLWTSSGWKFLATYTEDAAETGPYDAHLNTHSSFCDVDVEADTRLRAPECCVCFCDDELTSGIWCSNMTHFTCASCLSRHIAQRTERTPADAYSNAESLRDSEADLPCPHAGCDPACTGKFVDGDIAKHSSIEDFNRYLDSKAWVVEMRLREESRAKMMMQLEIFKAAESAAAALQAKKEFEERELAASLKEQFPNAYMCKNCKHGPVDHMACANLNSHHGEAAEVGRHGVTRGRAAVNNSCPACGWRAGTIQEWLKWDGVIRHTDGHAACEPEPEPEHDVHEFADQVAQLHATFPGLFALGNDEPYIVTLGTTTPPGDFAQARASIDAYIALETNRRNP